MNYEQWRHGARAWLFHFFGKTELAYDEYAIAFKQAPSASAASNLGYLAATRDRLPDAIRWFETATSLQPDDAEIWFNLGFVRERNRQRTEAIAAFREAVRRNPAQDRAWYGLGLAHAHLGDHGDAARAFEEAARLQPMHGEAWYHLGMAQHLAHNPERVRQVIEHLRSFDPKRSNQLIRETGRSDLSHLVREMPF